MPLEIAGNRVPREMTVINRTRLMRDFAIFMSPLVVALQFIQKLTVLIG